MENAIVIILGLVILYVIYKMLKPNSSDVQCATENESEEAIDNDNDKATIEAPTLFKANVEIPTFALILGNSETDIKKFGSKNRLEGVEKDLRNIYALLGSYKGIKNTYGKEFTTFEQDTFNYAKATSMAFKDACIRVAKLGENIVGEKYFIPYGSGHGSQVKNGLDDDKDGMAETRVFYDCVIKDDETIAFLLKTFDKSWKIFIIEDRCHSGGLSKQVFSVGSQIKSIGVVDSSLLKTLGTPPIIGKGEPMIKIQSAAKEEEYALDLGKEIGGAFTSTWVKFIAYLSGNTTYELANGYSVEQNKGKQVPEIKNIRDKVYPKWNNNIKIFN